MPSLACPVEGQGDVASLPVIVRRIAEAQGVFDLRTSLYRMQRYAIVRPGELERAIERAARSSERPRGILVLLDADDDLPCVLGPTLTARARAARPDVPSRVVLANREKEAWYLAAAESLRGRRGLPDDLTAPPDPEAIRGAKGRPYSEVADQPALGAVFDLELARQRARSFARLSQFVVQMLVE